MTDSIKALFPFPEPRRHSVLLNYLNEVLKWHGYIRFLGLPHLQENPDIAIDRLYVQPQVSLSQISADMASDKWPETEIALAVLERERHLMLLGDPGGGKSTLINWLAWSFACNLDDRWCRRMGPLVPLPLVLRELSLKDVQSFDDLLNTWLRHGVARPLVEHRDILLTLLKSGQAMVLLDGLDEIGDLAMRKRLRQAVWEGMESYQNSVWLLTSRLVGYEETPFDQKLDPRKTEGLSDGPDLSDSVLEYSTAIRQETFASVATHSAWLPRRFYLAPFNDRQIEVFAHNWYVLREIVGHEAERKARELVARIHDDAYTLRLARTPNLLTMMALIYRVLANLPHGKALLYEEIAKAYLQSIDEHRRIQTTLDFPLEQKKRWLAYIGFQLQRRRNHKTDNDGSERVVLATEDEVLQWIVNAMENSGYPANREFAVGYLKLIGERSGLLLPRGEGLYAFIHLSFQEYFAALYLAELIVSPEWAADGRSEADATVDKAFLQRIVAEPVWMETLVFLFELCANKYPRWIKSLTTDCFGHDAQLLALSPNDTREAKEKADAAAQLMVKLILDPHSGLPEPQRLQAAIRCASLDMELQQQQDYFSFRGVALSRLLYAGNPNDEAEISGRICRLIRNWLAEQAAVKRLSLTGSIVNDVSPLLKLGQLEKLAITLSSVTDFSPLAAMPCLTQLSIIWSESTDISSLASLSKLKNLTIASNRSVGLTPLSSLKNLQHLILFGPAVWDLAPLAKLQQLLSFKIYSFAVEDPSVDLSPLSELNNLNLLTFLNVRLKDLAPLAKLQALVSLDISNSGVADLTPLANLPKLKYLDISGTAITDLSPLAHRKDLEIKGIPKDSS